MAQSRDIARLDNVDRLAKILASALNSIQLLSVVWKRLVIGQFRLFSLLFIGHKQPHMIPVSFVKITESYEGSLVTINRQISYDSGLRNH